MMRFKKYSTFCTAAIVGLVLISACSKTPPPPGFITENLPPPKGAKVKEGDVPRTDYGRPYQYRLLGQALPEFEVVTTDHAVLNSNELISGWTIMEVWGIWCPDCVVDGPNVQKLSDALERHDTINFVTIHSPPSAARADEAFGKYASVDDYFAANDYNYVYVLDPDASAKSALQLPWVPSFLLIDPEGVIRGYRTDLHVGGETAVADFIADAESVINGGGFALFLP